MDLRFDDAGSHFRTEKRGFARLVGVEGDGTVIVQMIQKDGKVKGFAALPPGLLGYHVEFGAMFVVENFDDVCAALHVIEGPPQG